jgi:hypothetical protein
MDINPYESPKASQPPPAATNRSTFRGVRLEIYRIDGAQRLRERSFAFSSVRRFEIEGATLAAVVYVGWKLGRLPPRLAASIPQRSPAGHVWNAPHAYGIRNTRPVTAAASYTAPRMLSGKG